jgi:hypothetical protein
MSQTPAEPPVDGTALFLELAEALAPHLLLVRLLGQGGMGLVYLARDPALKRLVAVKVLSPTLALDDTARSRFAREAETMAAMSHPNIINVHQVGELAGSRTSYFVMQYVDGKNLSEVFPPGTSGAEGRVWHCLGEIASALAAAHRLGVVHRDIKPANVMYDPDSGRYLVLDFGISAILPRPGRAGHSEALTAENIRIGTPRYMSPEQASGQDVSGKSDVYSLGCLAYELLTGEPPFTGSTSMAVLAAHMIKDPPKLGTRRPEIDRQLATLIDRCLAKSPDLRPSAEDLTRAFLPSLKSLIEWPPPGLDPLHALGARFARTTALVALTGVAFFVALMIHPTVSRACCWRYAESSWLWNVLKHLSYATPIHFDDPDAMSVWYFLLDMTFLMLLIGLPFLIAHSWQLGAALRHGFRAGYPAGTLFDVGWDTYEDTTDLLNGTGTHSLLPQARRAAVLTTRRLRSMSLVTASMLALMGPSAWLYLGGAIPRPGTASLFGLPDALALWSWSMLAILAALGATGHLWRLLPGGSPRRYYSPSRQRAASIPRELVSVWLQSAGLRRPRELHFPAWLLTGIAPLLGILLALTSAVVLSVVFKSTARMLSAGVEARAWVAQVTRSTQGAPVEPPSTRAALALVTGTGGELERQAVGRIEPGRDFELSAFESLSYCLDPRAVLFGRSSGEGGMGPSSYGFTGPVSGWRNRLLEVGGLSGLTRRARNCSKALGPDVSTVADST